MTIWTDIRMMTEKYLVIFNTAAMFAERFFVIFFSITPSFEENIECTLYINIWFSIHYILTYYPPYIMNEHTIHHTFINILFTIHCIWTYYSSYIICTYYSPYIWFTIHYIWTYDSSYIVYEHMIQHMILHR